MSDHPHDDTALDAACCSAPAGSHCGRRVHFDRDAWFGGSSGSCESPPVGPLRPTRLVLLGAPGVGKGTQAAKLARHLRACHLSTGDLFRNLLALDPGTRTPSMETAVEHMRRGELVPDEIVVSLMRDRFRCLSCPTGFLLDGFPRTVAQAEALDRLLGEFHLAVTRVLHYDLPLEKTVERLSGRRVCPYCKALYHLESSRPRVDGICDRCGTALIQREDDHPEAIRIRLRAFCRSTAPLVDHFHRRGLLATVPADGPPDRVFDRSIQALNGSA
ncbi:MAG: adenylate kinase family protein [Limisphaerales bacterium]